jgi:hypothetical protein
MLILEVGADNKTGVTVLPPGTRSDVMILLPLTSLPDSGLLLNMGPPATIYGTGTIIITLMNWEEIM